MFFNLIALFFLFLGKIFNFYNIIIWFFSLLIIADFLILHIINANLRSSFKIKLYKSYKKGSNKKIKFAQKLKKALK